MRNFSWVYFTKTGDVDAFMLYKEADALALSEAEPGAVVDGAAGADGHDEAEAAE